MHERTRKIRKFLFSTATSATGSLLVEYHSVRVLQKCCSGDTFNIKLTFQHPKNDKSSSSDNDIFDTDGTDGTDFH